MDLNQPTPGQLTIVNGIPTAAAHVNQFRPYRGFGPIGAILPIFTSNYNGLQASAQKRFKGASQISVNYTWSHGLTTSQTDRSSAPQNTYNLRADYGPSQLDRTQIFTTNFVWEFPWMIEQRGVLGHILGGWQTSGIINIYGGLPLTVITSGLDPAGQAIPAGAASARPDLIGDPNGAKGIDFQSGATWFNTAAFEHVCPSVAGPKVIQLTPTTFQCINSRPGNSPRGVVRGPGFNRVDLSLFKNIKITEQVRLQFRTETFNLFNHTNPNAVSTTVGAATFGRITSYRDPRELQFGLKLNF